MVFFYMDELPQRLTINQSPKMDESYWNGSRQEINAWLKAKAPELAALYEGSLRILYTKDFPGKIRFLGNLFDNFS